MNQISSTITLHRRPKDGAPGKDAPTLTVSASCHDGEGSHPERSYVLVNGNRITQSTYFTYTWHEDTHVLERTADSGYILIGYRGFAIYYINANDLSCAEVDYFDTYGVSEEGRNRMYDQMDAVTQWLMDNTTAPLIMVIVSADATSCEAKMRQFLQKYGSPLSDSDVYTRERRRHYFVTNIRTAKAGQAYEEISADATQKIVTFNVNIGEGVILQGGKGTTGYNGCIIRRTEWEEGKHYRNDTALTPDDAMAQYGDPTRYIDEVMVSAYNGGDGCAYQCILTHTSSADNKPQESGGGDPATYWQKLNDVSPLRTPYADIDRAVVGYIQTKQLVLEQTVDGTPKPYGAFGTPTGENDYPLWFGGETPQQAVTRIDRQGQLSSRSFVTTGEQSHIEIIDGVMNIFGTLSHPTIRVGVDADGCAFLSFYNKDGLKMYDLGPQGLSKIDTEDARFETKLLCPLPDVNPTASEANAKAFAAVLRNITDYDCTRYYKFFAKYTRTDTTVVYYYGTNHDTPQVNPPTEHRQVFQSSVLNPHTLLPASPRITAGYYALPNNGRHMEDLHGQYFERIYQYRSGVEYTAGYIFWGEDGNGNIISAEWKSELQA